MRQIPFQHQPKKKHRLRVFTWHIHGSYLYYLSRANCDFYIPVNRGDMAGYGGRSGAFPWGSNVFEVDAKDVKRMEFDCVLFQHKEQYFKDQYEIFSPKQLRLPKIFLEHDPPRSHPTDALHPVQNRNVLLVHVTDFNRLMWDNGITPTAVITHGVFAPKGISANGTKEKEKGLVMVNNLKSRGRRLGADIFRYVRRRIPLDLLGMNSEELGGLGEIPHDRIWEVLPRYRFFFNPIRYTSLGLSACEAMFAGLPIISFATTEMATVVKDGVTGFARNDPDELINKMRLLLDDQPLALRLGRNARNYANERFSIERFAREWEDALWGWTVRQGSRQRVKEEKVGIKGIERTL